ncbi:MAG: DUF3800 domain-containing protein [Thermomicrobiales bacterium]
MAVRTIYCDESGFTGYNLLDPAQPIFVIASADVSEPRAEEILQHSFPRYQGAEFKFSSIWRSKSRAGLLTFASYLRAFTDTSFIYMIDKRFAVLTKLIDMLVEPFITDAGYDFYDDGFCWKYCNYVHFGLTQFAPPALLDTLLRHYQEFSREPTADRLAALQMRLRLMARSIDEPPALFLEQMALGAEMFHRFHDLDSFRGSNELQLGTMFAIVAYWRQKHPEDFAIIHDASSNFLRGEEMWRRVTSYDVPEQQHRKGDGTFVEFPLRVVSTTAVDSRKSRSIQFCDVLSGLAARHFSPSTKDDDRRFMDEAIEAGLKHVTYDGVRPQTVFPDQIPPKRLNGPDIVDKMRNIIFGAHKADC